MKPETAWVIMRDDGKYARYNPYIKIWQFDDEIYYANMFPSEEITLGNISLSKQNLQNCRPVKVEIRVVEEEK